MTDRLRTAAVVVFCLVTLGVAPGLHAQEIPALPSGASDQMSGPYTPPPCVAGVPFADITCASGFDPWIEQFALDGITAGCGGGLYCPGTPVTRDQMAVFIEKAMRGTANWPPHTQIVWAVKNSDGTPNPTASGTALLSAVAAIPATGNDVPSFANPWLVKVGPGIFDLGAGSLVVPDFVSVEGAGRKTTTIRSTASSSSSSATIVAGDALELRDFAVINTGGAAYAKGVLVSAGSPALRRVAITVTPGTTFSVGVHMAGGTSPSLEDIELTLYNDGSSTFAGVYTDAGSNPTLDRVTVALGAAGTGGGPAIQVNGNLVASRLKVTTRFYGSGTATLRGVVVTGNVTLRDSDVAGGCAGNDGSAYGVYGGGFVNLTNVSAAAWRFGNASCPCYGVYLYDAVGTILHSYLGSYNYALYTANATAARTVHVDNSVLDGNGGWIGNGASYTTVIGATRISDGHGKTNSGTLTCAGVYGTTGTFYPSTCP